MKLFFIKIFAAIVKCFPSLALCFTKKTNRYNDLFLLPFKKERYHLSRMSKEKVAKRIWSDKARVYALSSEDFYTYFASEIYNATQFDALYNSIEISNSVKQDLIAKLIEKNAYTLSDEQAEKVCLELDCIEVLYQYQFTKFKIELVEEFNNQQLFVFLAATVKFGDIKKRLNSDVITYLINLYDGAEDDQTLSVGIDNFTEALVKERYPFNTTQAEIMYQYTRDLLETWIKNNTDAHLVFGVLRQFSDSVCRLDIMRYLYKNCKKSGKYDVMAQLIPFIWNNDDGEYDVVKILTHLIKIAEYPCPNLFYLIRRIENRELHDANFDLCIKHNLLHKIDESEMQFLNDEKLAVYLIDMAEREMLTNEGLKSVTDKALKAKLIEILEDNAQVAWIRQLIYDYGKCGSTKDDIIDSLCKQNLCDKTLILLLKECPSWVDYYQNTHCLSNAVFEKAMSDNAYASIVTKQIAKYGISKEGYEVLLLSTNKALAIFAKEHIK